MDHARAVMFNQYGLRSVNVALAYPPAPKTSPSTPLFDSQRSSALHAEI